MIDPSDPTFLRMRRYRDGRVTAFVGNKELGPPEYRIQTERWERPDLPNLYGEPTGISTVMVTENKSGEMVAVFQTRDAELRPETPYYDERIHGTP